MQRRTLLAIDGPRAGTTKDVRADRTTMATMQLPDGTWLFYDGKDHSRARGIACVAWRETGTTLVLGKKTLHVVTEVNRYYWKGVL